MRVDSVDNAQVYNVRKVLDCTDEDIIDTTKCIKAARESENVIHGLVSHNTDFRSGQEECFLANTGATVSIVGLQVARDNKLKIKLLKAQCKIIEASGGQLDIVGETEMFVKLKRC